MTQKAFAEGGRALVYLLAQHADVVEKAQLKKSVNSLTISCHFLPQSLRHS